MSVQFSISDLRLNDAPIIRNQFFYSNYQFSARMCLIQIPKTLIFHAISFLLFVCLVAIISDRNPWKILLFLLLSYFVVTCYVVLRVMLMIYREISIQHDLADFGKFWAATPGNRFKLIRDNSTNEIIGCCGYFRKNWSDDDPRERVCEIKRMFIRAKYRGSGVAKLLFDAVLESAKADGYTQCVLMTSNFQIASIKFYTRNGFREFSQESVGQVLRGIHVMIYYFEKQL